jgi:hypothetical protein
MATETGLCVCGHPYRAHEHYRPGTECVLCDAGQCRRFRSATPWWRRLLGSR